jgi:hypothetical protein
MQITRPGVVHEAVARKREERAARLAAIQSEHLEAMLREGWTFADSGTQCVCGSPLGWALVPPAPQAKAFNNALRLSI